MKQKIMVGILVVLMMTVSLVGVLNSDVKAFDTNPEPFREIVGPIGNYSIYGVAWDSSGMYAMMVGDNYSAELNWYAQTITNITGQDPNVKLNDVVYDKNDDAFYAVGVNGTGDAAVYEWTPGTSMTEISPLSTMGEFKRVVMGDNGFLAVGVIHDDDDHSLAMYYDISMHSWTSLTELEGAGIYAVSFVNGTFFLFEISPEGGTNFMVISESNAGNGGTPSSIGSFSDFEMVSDAEVNGYFGNDITLVGTLNSSGSGFLYTFDAEYGNITDPLLVTTSNPNDMYQELHSIAWDVTGSWAVVVGSYYNPYRGDSEYVPLVYQYGARDTYVAELSSYNGASNIPSGVAMRPPHSPSSATIVGPGSGGGATILSSTTTSQQITANTIYPHINYIDIVDNATNSYVNRQMNVDEGSATNEFYYVEVDAYYGNSSSGLAWSNIGTVDVYAWFDGGNTTSSSSYGSEVAGNENLQFHFLYQYNSGTPIWTLVYPSSGEVQFFRSACSDVAIDSYNHVLQFAFAPQQQMHNGSAGQEGGNVDPDNRYSLSGTWHPEDQSTINALNDPYTWDLRVLVTDDNGNAKTNAYDEFGIYKFTDLGAWSLQNDLSAAGAPGANGVDFLSGGNPLFDLEYRSNCDYSIRVYMDDDLRSGTTTDVISASSISVDGGTISGGPVYFSGAGASSAIYIVGDGTPVYESPYATGTSTLISQVGNQLHWRIDIPTVAEASYTANAVYEILHA